MSVAAIRLIGWLAVLSVIILSLVPASYRPHVLPNNYAEHFVAYIVVGYLLASGYPALGQRLVLGAMLGIGAGSLEIAQLFIAGRISSVGDFAAGVSGALIGLNLSSVVRRLFGRLSKAV